jgi:5-methylcytosine-specific restriction endonuclease McrA
MADAKIPSSRAEAKALNQKHYINGKPCPSGHVGKRYASTGTCVECVRGWTRGQVANGYFKGNYEKTRDGKLAVMRVRYEATKAQRLKEAREWARKNPEKRRLISRSYKARRRAQESGGISTAELGRWIRAQKKVCYWCSKRCAKSFHVDHYVPLARGGKHDAENLVIACSRCNLTKSARDPLAFARTVGRLF